MSRTQLVLVGALFLGVTVVGGCASTKTSTPEASMDGQGMPLPKGWTPDDLQACMMAGTPGREHENLMKLAGTWSSDEKMRMGPDMPQMNSQGTWTMTPMLDGRYLQLDAAGEIPGMGPYKGFGLMGFDNVSQKYVATYIDQMSTGMMHGVGKMSSDGKVLTLNYTFNCPITKKPSTFREIMTFQGDGRMHVEMYMTDPKSGKEYQCMIADLTKTN